MKYTVKERFLKYVQIDTEADPMSNTSPSSMKQLELSRLLVEELNAIGIENELSEQGYVYATLPANTDSPCPTIFFCAHVDTTPDCSGKDVKPIVHHNYQGSDIVLPDDESQIIQPTKHPNLLKKIGHDIITASGKTLLGSDDKSGVAVIMDAFYQMAMNPALKHGTVKILFTTDEEIGRGVQHVDLEKLNADFGYTLDGGELGSFENENFSAHMATITITGVSAHPCCAKGKMENAIKIISEILSQLPKDHLSPESTEGKEGFIHPTKVEAKLESATASLLLRDFNTKALDDQAQFLHQLCKKVLENYPNSSYTMEVKQQYLNMKDVLDSYPHVVALPIKAMENLGITPNLTSIRGGTDGAVLSHKGLPCPNLFAGEQGIHSKQEWVSVQDMERAVDTILEICRLAATENV